MILNAEMDTLIETNPNLAENLLTSNDFGVAAAIIQACLCCITYAASSKDVNIVHFTESQRYSLNGVAESLFLWAESHNVSNGSFDQALRSSEELKKIVIEVLKSLAKHTLISSLLLQLEYLATNKS